jgi:AcrR family transcriptional regulator
MKRIPADDRREVLLEVAKALLVEGGASNVTMGTVANRGEVTRALVYKHFENREAILRDLFRREAGALDKALRRKVDDAPDGLEPKLRAFADAVLETATTQRDFFGPLRTFGADANHSQQQRSWDRRTTRFFSKLAAEKYGLDEAVCEPATNVMLAGVVSLMPRARANPSAQTRQQLVDLYVAMSLGGFERLAKEFR